MGYGFRLYEVKLVGGSGKSKPIEFDKCGLDRTQHVSTWLRRVFTKLEGYQSLSKMPQQRPAVDDPLPDIRDHEQPGTHADPVVDFHDHTKTPATRIRFEFSYGRVGRVPFALGPTPDDYIDLQNRATGHRYRGILYLPPDGTVGLLALETIPSSAHPIESLNAWLARAAVEVAAEDAATVAALAEADRDGLEPAPFKLNFKQLVNLERLSKMIKETSDVELVLRRTIIGAGGKKTAEKVRMVSKIETVAERNKAVAVARKLYEKTVGESQDLVGMAELESLAPGDVAGLEFNDGYIKVDDGNNGVKKVGIDVMDRYFNYPIATTTRPTTKKWEHGVAAEVVSMQALLGVELDVS
jgi:hypothetical protein